MAFWDDTVDFLSAPLSSIAAPLLSQLTTLRAIRFDISSLLAANERTCESNQNQAEGFGEIQKKILWIPIISFLPDGKGSAVPGNMISSCNSPNAETRCRPIR
eukprot:scaffold17582_cov72-Cyclotella_meneghiniana.AAC.2